jgi:hypothetical protein
MKIIRKDKPILPKTVDMNEIPIGEIFSGSINTYPNGLFLRAYRTIISLDKPDHIWYDRDDLQVVNYIEVDAELIIRRKK